MRVSRSTNGILFSSLNQNKQGHQFLKCWYAASQSREVRILPVFSNPMQHSSSCISNNFIYLRTPRRPRSIGITLRHPKISVPPHLRPSSVREGDVEHGKKFQNLKLNCLTDFYDCNQ